MLTVPLCPLFLCAYCSSVPTVPLFLLFLCAHCSSVPTVPLCLLFLCAHCSFVPTVPLCPLFLCSYCSSVPSVPLCPLFLCALCSSVPTVPLSPPPPPRNSVYEWLTISTLGIWMINDFNFRYMRNNPRFRMASFSKIENAIVLHLPCVRGLKRWRRVNAHF